MKSLYKKSISRLLFLFCIVCFSCAPKYGAYFPSSGYDANNYAKLADKAAAGTEADEHLLVSMKPVIAASESEIKDAEIRLLASIKIRDTKLVQNTAKKKDEVLMEERGVLALVEKEDRNATMSSREELIMDALQVRLQSMTKKEKKEFRKEVKHLAKSKDIETLSPAYDIYSPEDVEETNISTLLLVIIAILLPPLAVFLHQGEINKNFWINLLLTLLFYIPGLIHALILIL